MRDTKRKLLLKNILVTILTKMRQLINYLTNILELLA